MTIRLAALEAEAISIVRTRVTHLAAFGDNAPPLLRRIPLGKLQARGVLREAIVTYEQAGSALATAATPSHLFDRARVLLLDAENRQVGVVGLSSLGDDVRFDYLAERGCDELVAALQIAEEFSDGEGTEFEARILVIQDLILQLLVLVPLSSNREVHVLPLQPIFGHSPVIRTPEPAGVFMRWLDEAWSHSRPRAR